MQLMLTRQSEIVYGVRVTGLKRQRAWQLKQISLGNCPQCGKPNNSGRKRCAPCRQREKPAMAAYYQSHKKKLKAYAAEYRKAHREKARAYAAAHYQKKKLAAAAAKSAPSPAT